MSVELIKWVKIQFYKLYIWGNESILNPYIKYKKFKK